MYQLIKKKIFWFPLLGEWINRKSKERILFL